MFPGPDLPTVIIYLLYLPTYLPTYELNLSFCIHIPPLPLAVFSPVHQTLFTYSFAFYPFRVIHPLPSSSYLFIASTTAPTRTNPPPRNEPLKSMIRDPFNIRSNSAFNRPHPRSVPNQQDSASLAVAHDLAMAFSMPKTVPSFENRQRDLEDRFWGSGASSSKGLPMYKDKPYAYSPYEQKRPIWKRKRVIGLLTFLVLTLLYWSSSSAKKPQKSTEPTDWTYSGLSKDDKKANWDHRRDRVVEAFELSWDAYRRYAWGASRFSALETDYAC